MLRSRKLRAKVGLHSTNRVSRFCWSIPTDETLEQGHFGGTEIAIETDVIFAC
jgi:hypothetical protein